MGSRKSNAESGLEDHRAPVPELEYRSPTAPGTELERRVCPNCRLYFDTGADSDSVFCSTACERRHKRGEWL